MKLLRSGPFVTIFCISDQGNFRWGKNLWSKAWLWIVAKCITISGLSSGWPILLQISWQNCNNCTQSTIPKVSKASAFVEAVLSTHKWQNLLEDFRTLIFYIQRSSSYMAVMKEVMPKILFWYYIFLTFADLLSSLRLRADGYHKFHLRHGYITCV
jgi:hypothetical protein